jgi:hypothetical protein
MSGYLQRLVQTAAHPAESVHPRTGSIFSPTDDRDPHLGEPEEASEAISSVDASPRMSPNTTTAPSASLRAPVAAPEYRPMVPVNDADSVGTSQDYRPSLNDDVTTRAAPARKQSHTTEISEPANRRAPRITYHPLIEQPVAAKEHLQPVAGWPRADAPRQNAPSASRTATAQSQADEIQIHIGRIEVTAVHPPAPQRAKLPDKGPSLDAYLNRREWRAR